MTTSKRRKRNRCTRCGLVSVPGLVMGHGLCRFHWAEAHWGREWALRWVPEHPEAGHVVICWSEDHDDNNSTYST